MILVVVGTEAESGYFEGCGYKSPMKCCRIEGKGEGDAEIDRQRI